MPTKRYAGTDLSQFDCFSDDDIKELIASSSKNCCLLDPLPSSLRPACVDTLLPIITKMVNLSLQSGVFAKTLKNVLVCPLLKKPGLDHKILKNFYPMSNLQFVSKLTEKAVAKQITEHMNINGLLPSSQSAYRKYYSTETALLKVKNDLLLNMNNGHVTVLVLDLDFVMSLRYYASYLGYQSALVLNLSSFENFKVHKGLTPLYLSELISVLPPSSYNLRRNYNGTLLCTPKFKSKRTLGDRDFPQPRPLYGIRYH